jgi:hypothetical protein
LDLRWRPPFTSDPQWPWPPEQSFSRMCLPPATKPSPMSVAGKRSGIWRWVPAIGGDTTPPLFEGRWWRY